MYWMMLVAAGVLEIGWAIGLKYTHGFTRFWPSAGTIACMVVSVSLLGAAMKAIPLGTAYAIWTGIGAVGTVIAGMLLFGDSTDALRVGCLGMIVAGIVGLKVFS